VTEAFSPAHLPAFDQADGSGTDAAAVHGRADHAAFRVDQARGGDAWPRRGGNTGGHERGRRNSRGIGQEGATTERTRHQITPLQDAAIFPPAEMAGHVSFGTECGDRWRCAFAG